VLNYVFLHVLGFEGFGKSGAVAADTVRPAFGQVGDKLISLMITISAVGALSAQIFTGGRIYYAMGKDHPLYAWLGRWSQRAGTPVRSLVLQAAVSVILIVVFGLSESKEAGAFEQIVGFTAPLFWGFFTMVGLSVFVFRAFEPKTPRPFRVPLFPLPPILFCLMTVFMLYASIDYAINVGGKKTFWWVAVMAVGIVMVFVNRLFTPKQQE
jgi:amino acid transporter